MKMNYLETFYKKGGKWVKGIDKGLKTYYSYNLRTDEEWEEGQANKLRRLINGKRGDY